MDKRIDDDSIDVSNKFNDEKNSLENNINVIEYTIEDILNYDDNDDDISTEDQYDTINNILCIIDKGLNYQNDKLNLKDNDYDRLNKNIADNLNRDVINCVDNTSAYEIDHMDELDLVPDTDVNNDGTFCKESFDANSDDYGIDDNSIINAIDNNNSKYTILNDVRNYDIFNDNVDDYNDNIGSVYSDINKDFIIETDNCSNIIDNTDDIIDNNHICNNHNDNMDNDIDDINDNNYSIVKNQLCDDWVQHYDETYQRYYYINHITNEFQWFNPLENSIDSTDNITTIINSNADDDNLSNNGMYDYTINSEYEINGSDIDYNTYSNPDECIDDNGYNYQNYSYSNTSYDNNYVDYNRTDHDEYSIQTNDSYSRQDSDSKLNQENHYINSYYKDDNVNNMNSMKQNKIKKKIKKKKKKKNDISYHKRSNDTILVGGTNQDYLNMARLYKLERPYSDPYNLDIICVLCHIEYANMVFFPCEHRCVCQTCINKEHICTDNDYFNQQNCNINNNDNMQGYCNCSVCANVIKYILPFDNGLEIEKYWTWVLNENILLPPGFLRNFRYSEAVIKAAYIRNNDNLIPDSDSFENTWQIFQKKTNEKCNLS